MEMFNKKNKPTECELKIITIPSFSSLVCKYTILKSRIPINQKVIILTLKSIRTNQTQNTNPMLAKKGLTRALWAQINPAMLQVQKVSGLEIGAKRGEPSSVGG